MEEGGPSNQQEVHETQTTGVPVFITYEKGTRRLFVAAKLLLSPPRVEAVSFPSPDHMKMLSSPGMKGALPSSSAEQVHDRGKQPLHDEGPSEGQDRDFVLIEEEDNDLGSQISRLKDVIIKEKEVEMQALSLDLERAKWIINYLEQQNKQLEGKKTIMEPQTIRENRQMAKRRKIKLTSLEQEIEADRESWLERVNIHLEKLLDKANKEKNMLCHMDYHYLARNKICKTRIKSLKAKLKRALKAKKEQDKLKILVEASLA